MSAEAKDKQIKWLKKANVITEALPYIRSYEGNVVVIKLGGRSIEVEEGSHMSVSKSIVFLKKCGIKVVIVHGGGVQIESMLSRLGKVSRYEQGLRISDRDTVEVVEMVLSGQVNKQIVSKLNLHGCKAVGLSGRDANIINARKKEVRDKNGHIVDLGQVGEVESTDVSLLGKLLDGGFTPVLAPIGEDREGNVYNINADYVAASMAESLRAKRLLMLSDVPGIYGLGGELISEIGLEEATAMIESGSISGGMIPKVEVCLQALRNGVEGVVILDGTNPYALLLEIFTDFGTGTLIKIK